VQLILHHYLCAPKTTMISGNSVFG